MIHYSVPPTVRSPEEGDRVAIADTKGSGYYDDGYQWTLIEGVILEINHDTDRIRLSDTWRRHFKKGDIVGKGAREGNFALTFTSSTMKMFCIRLHE